MAALQLELGLDNKTRYFSCIDPGLSVSFGPDFCKVRIWLSLVKLFHHAPLSQL